MEDASMQFKTNHELYTSAEIKQEAKAQLKGYWREAILISLIPVLFSFLFIYSAADGENTSLFFDLIHDFLGVGVTFSFMNVLRERDYVIAPLREILAPFRSKYFINLLKLKLLKYVVIFLWMFLFIIPGIVKSYGYSQAELIYKDTVDRTGKQPSVRACLAESQKIMMGHKADLFVLDLSFFGWYILNIFTAGILSIWLTPYKTMSRVVFYENLSKDHYLNRGRPERSEHSPRQQTTNIYEEVGKDPDDFRDFDDF